MYVCMYIWMHVPLCVFVSVNRKGEGGFMKGFLVVSSGRLRPPVLMRTSVSLHSPKWLPLHIATAVLGENCEGHWPPPLSLSKKRLIFHGAQSSHL